MREPFSKFGLLFSKTEAQENNQENVVPLNSYVQYILRKEQENSKKSGKNKRKQNSVEAIPSFHNKTSKKQREKSMKDKCLEDTNSRKKRGKAPASIVEDTNPRKKRSKAPPSVGGPPSVAEDTNPKKKRSKAPASVLEDSKPGNKRSKAPASVLEDSKPGNNRSKAPASVLEDSKPGNKRGKAPASVFEGSNSGNKRSKVPASVLEDTNPRKKHSNARPASPTKDGALVHSEHNPNVIFISPEEIIRYKKHFKKLENNTTNILHKVPQLGGRNRHHDLKDIHVFSSTEDLREFKNRPPSSDISKIDMSRILGSSLRAKHFSQRRSLETDDGKWLSKRDPLLIDDESQHILNDNMNREYPVRKFSVIGSDHSVHKQKRESHKHGRDTKKKQKRDGSKRKSSVTNAKQTEKQIGRHSRPKEEKQKRPKSTNRKDEPDLKDYIGNIQGILNRNLFSFLKDLPQQSLDPKKEEESKQKHRHHKHKSKKHHHEDYHHITEPAKLDKTELIKQYLRSHDFGEDPVRSKLPEEYKKPFIKSLPNWNSKDKIPEMNGSGENNVILDKSCNEKHIDKLLENLDSTGCLVRKVCPVLEIIPIKSLQNRSSRQLAATYSQVLEKKKHSVAFRNYYRYTSQMASSNSDSNRICQDLSEPSVDGSSEIQKSNIRFQSKIPLLKAYDVVSPRNKLVSSSTKSERTPPASPARSKTITEIKSCKAKPETKPKATKPKPVVHKEIEEGSIQTDGEKQESSFSFTRRSTGKSPRINQKIISTKRSLQSQLGKNRDVRKVTGVTFSLDQTKRSSFEKVRKPIRITTAKSKQYDNASQADELPPSIKSIETSISNVIQKKRSSSKISKFDDNRKTRTTSVSFINTDNNISEEASVASDTEEPFLQAENSEELFNEDYSESEPAQYIDICNKEPEKQSKPWSNSNSYSYALERFAAKSAVMSDMAKNHTTLLLTKSYRDADQLTRLQKRKLYGETVRQNLMHQTNPMKIPPQVVEVRFVTSVRKNSQVTVATPNVPAADSLQRHKTCLGLCKDDKKCCEAVVEQPKPTVTPLKLHQSIDTLNPFYPKSKPKVCHSNNNIQSNDNYTERNESKENNFNPFVCKNENNPQVDEIKAEIPIEEPKKSTPLVAKSNSTRSRGLRVSSCNSYRSLLNQEMDEARAPPSTNPFVPEENGVISCTKMISRDQFDELFEMPIDDALDEILNENSKFLKKDFSYHAPKISIDPMSEPDVMESPKTSQDSLSRWYQCADSPYKDVSLTQSNIDEIFRNNKFEPGQFQAYDSRSQEHTPDSFSVPGSEESGYATAPSKEASAAEKFFQRPSIKALLRTSMSSFDEDLIIARLQKINLDSNDFSDEAFPDESSSNCSTDSCLKSVEYFNPFCEEPTEEEARDECMEDETKENCTEEKNEPVEIRSESHITVDSKEVEFDDAVEVDVVSRESIAPSGSSSSTEHREESERVDSNRNSDVFAAGTELSLVSECSEKEDEPCEVKPMDSFGKKSNMRKTKRSAWMKKIKNVFKIHHKKKVE